MTSEHPEPVPDTATGTGNDDATPGELPRGPLDPEERAVLADLRSGGDDEVVTEAEEDSPAMTEAVQNDSVTRGRG